MSASEEEGSVNAILSRIREMQSDLPPKAKQIAALIIAQPETVVHMSITDFSEACGVSEGTTVAFCRRVGVRGFQELKIVLAQDLIEPVRFIQEDLHRGDDPATVTDHIFAAHAASLHETRRLLSTEALAEAVRLIKAAQRIEIYGIGMRHRSRRTLPTACYSWARGQ
jgi:RpiR family transcriptional regulator, carbohydrate utilization regulator